MRILLLLLAAACTPLCAQVVVDNTDSEFSITFGTGWSTGTSAGGKYGSDYRYAAGVGASGNPTNTAEWRPNLAMDTYDVQVWYPSGSNRANDTPFTIYHAAGNTTVRINQQANGGQWVNLGTFDFDAGTNGYVEIGNNAQPGQVVMADAVRWTSGTTTPPATDEFRGVWVSRFEWPSTSPSIWKANIDTIMNNASNGNFNSVVLQMRGDTTTLYPSPNEPLSSLIALGSGDDPLAYAINAAHALGLKLHCYFNTHVCTSAFASANPSWIIADSTGTPISSPVDGYYWLAPGHPDVQAYLRTQVMYIVNNYPTLDGIHFDRIRMPEPNYSYDSVSEARRAGPGNPGSLNFDDWTADQITRWLRDVYAEVRSVNPNLQLSAAPLGLYHWTSYSGYSTGYYYGLPRHQDAKAWLAAGAMDWIAPQVYWPDGGGNPDFSDIVPDWQASASGRHIYPGMSATSDANANETISEISAARGFGCQGTMVWSYGSANSLNFWSALKATGAPYEAPASPPDLPWLSTPTDAIVYGTIKDQGGTPITDAWITKGGSTYTAVSAVDGFWSWLKLAPGNHTFTVNVSGLGTAIVNVNGLTAGEVREVNIVVAPAGVATRFEVQQPAPTGVKSGDAFSVTVNVVDSTGTLVTTGAYDIQVVVFGVGTLTGPTTGTTSNGSITFNWTYDGTDSVTFGFVSPTSALSYASHDIQFTSTDSGGGEDNGGCAVTARASPWWSLLLLLPFMYTARRRATH